MCRLLVYTGPPLLAADLLLYPTRSIIRQSFDARERAHVDGAARAGGAYTVATLNADGFGLAFYDATKNMFPCVFTESQPAWNSKNLSRLSEKIVARCFLAHVRAAGPGLGAVCDCKTHPFVWGRYSWMHNGEIAGFGAIRRRLLQGLSRDESFNLALAHGATDTAVAFAIFVDQLSSPTELLSPTALVHHLKATMQVIYEAMEAMHVSGSSKLNFVVSDGETTLASRYTIDFNRVVQGPTLYYASGCSFASTELTEETRPPVADELIATAAESKPRAPTSEYRIFHTERTNLTTIVASEPLTEVRDDWIFVPNNHVVVINANSGPLCAPLFLKIPPCIGARLAAKELERVLSSLEAAVILSSTLLSVSSSGTLALREVVVPVSNHKPALLRSSSSLDSDSHLTFTAPTTLSSSRTPPRLKSIPATMMRSSSERFQAPFAPDPNEAHDDDEDSDSSVTRARQQGVEQINVPYHVLQSSGQTSVSTFFKCKHMLFSADGGVSGGRVCGYDLLTKSLVSWSSSWGVLAMTGCVDREILIGSRSDGYLIIWGDIFAKGELKVVHKICLPRIGHVLSMSLFYPGDDHGSTQTPWIIFGSQDGNVRRLPLPQRDENDNEDDDKELGPLQRMASVNSNATESHASTPAIYVQEESYANSNNDGGEEGFVLRTCCLQMKLQDRVARSDCARSHCGLVQTVTAYKQSIFSGSSCGLIKRWDARTGRCSEVIGGHTLAVMELVVDKEDGILYSCSRDGTVRVRNVQQADSSFHEITLRTQSRTTGESLTCLAVFRVKNLVCSGSALGGVWIWDLNRREFEFPDRFLNVSSLPINCLTLAGTDLLAVGSASSRISLWSFSTRRRSSVVESSSSPAADLDQLDAATAAHHAPHTTNNNNSGTDDEALLEVLTKFCAFRSVSANPANLRDCVKCAQFVTSLMEGLGVETRFCCPRGKIPVILGKVTPQQQHPESALPPSSSVFIYAHYDVVECDATEWKFDPWEVRGLEGFLYGRGVSDDKGPILCMLFAAVNMRNQGKLRTEVVFCIEGEEESGASLHAPTRNLVPALRENMEFISPDGRAPAAIFISNNTWCDEERVCLTRSMRGVLDAEIAVSGANRDLHSGVFGTVYEPLDELIQLINRGSVEMKRELKERTALLSASDVELLEAVDFNVADLARNVGIVKTKHASGTESLAALWAGPSVSFSAVETSNSQHSFRRIPRQAIARVSVHFVPDLTGADVKELLERHITAQFQALDSPNSLSIHVHQIAEWWRGDVGSVAFRAASQAIEDVWGVRPLLVGEGGSYGGVTSFLESELNSRAVHIPLAQAGDGSHLRNERIRVVNLLKGKEVFERLFCTLFV